MHSFRTTTHFIYLESVNKWLVRSVESNKLRLKPFIIVFISKKMKNNAQNFAVRQFDKSDILTFVHSDNLNFKMFS